MERLGGPGAWGVRGDLGSPVGPVGPEVWGIKRFYKEVSFLKHAREKVLMVIEFKSFACPARGQQAKKEIISEAFFLVLNSSKK